MARTVPRNGGVSTGAEVLVWDDAVYRESNIAKAERAGTLVYTRETGSDFPDFYVADAALKGARRITDGQAQLKPYLWSSGVRLIEYTSDTPSSESTSASVRDPKRNTDSKKLQAALFIPANYEPGRQYPTIVYIYERLSNAFNQFADPWHSIRPLYTSNGYAVLMPDISYTYNDPGMSAVWCLLPAVKAAVAAGIVDPARVGLHGHSWGGYQTGFLVTQTDAFKAAVAGAPFTDMVSAYNQILRSLGSASADLIENNHGRFRGPYWDHWDAYIRNSPVAQAPKMRTPLLIMHNDGDTAVNFSHGIEYYNALRRLKKPVVLLQYVGEGHGLSKPANWADYMVRMREFFDHHLKGAPAPDWWTQGVPRLDMEKHLAGRQPKKTLTPVPDTVTDPSACGRRRLMLRPERSIGSSDILGHLQPPKLASTGGCPSLGLMR